MIVMARVCCGCQGRESAHSGRTE